MVRLVGLMLVMLGSVVTTARAHDGDHPIVAGGAKPHPEQFLSQSLPEGRTTGRTTGEGKFTFRLKPIALPPLVKEHLSKAHGGFAVDRGGDGSAYFALAGAGLLRLTPDLSRIDVIGGDPQLISANIHNAALFRQQQATYLALPSDQAEKVFITDLEGQLKCTVMSPYNGTKPFRVCDVEVVDGLLIAVNGYADNVCFSCRVGSEPDGVSVSSWNAETFGGQVQRSQKEHGKFGTAHGITRVPDSDVVSIADRANSRIETYTTTGRYIAGLELPEGCLPCDIDYYGPYAVVGCLKGPAENTPAPIYILEDGNIVSELNVGKDLGLDGFTHIHNAAFRVLIDERGEKRIYVLVYAWNPGNFAILEQVVEH